VTEAHRIENVEKFIHGVLVERFGSVSLREGLRETPKRWAKAFADQTSGYEVDVDGLFKTFEDGAEGCDQMVVVRRIAFYSLCEHHLAPFFGTATVAYLPRGRVVGLSKLARVVGAFSKRLQVQERMTNEIADAVNRNLQPKGVGVVVTARHMCMESRGVRSCGSETITSAMRGSMLEDINARQELLALHNS
jgi:GTP cyclohydrolase I